MTSWYLKAPLSVAVTKSGTKFALNLNIYRNAFHHTLNSAKVEFGRVMAPQVRELPVFSKVAIQYFLYPKTKRLCDIANVCSVVDKFLCDTLVGMGKLPDDNYKHVIGVSYEFGEVDPKNPRVEIFILDQSQEPK